MPLPKKRPSSARRFIKQELFSISARFAIICRCIKYITALPTTPTQISLSLGKNIFNFFLLVMILPFNLTIFSVIQVIHKF